MNNVLYLCTKQMSGLISCDISCIGFILEKINSNLKQGTT